MNPAPFQNNPTNAYTVPSVSITTARRGASSKADANGNYFIVGGQLAYVAEVGETIKATNGESDARLRVVYANGTKSNLLRSLSSHPFVTEHRLFGAAQIDLTITDRFGNPVKPREWFLVPLHVIDEAVKRIRDGSITDVMYDPNKAQLVAYTNPQ